MGPCRNSLNVARQVTHRWHLRLVGQATLCGGSVQAFVGQKANRRAADHYLRTCSTVSRPTHGPRVVVVGGPAMLSKSRPKICAAADHSASFVRIADQLGDSPFGVVHRRLAPSFSIVVLWVMGRHGTASRNFSVNVLPALFF
uniref:Uncharacterized protein n=1 Tax=Solanum tuberosum TaxID=4113 RepID=M1DUG0_SOLTU